MAKFIIEGGKPLRGTIKVSGTKNAALPIIAATLLTHETCMLENVPQIDDVEVMLEIAQDLGVEVIRHEGGKVEITAKNIKNTELKPELVQKLRASLLFMGPLVVREGNMKMRHPGGCIIGRRPVGIHFEALKKLGVDISQDQRNYIVKAYKLAGCEIYLGEASVTATENTVMAAVLTPGTTKIKFAACEPHVQDLCNFLNKMGAKISGIGTSTIIIEGVNELRGASHRIVPDVIEAGTFAALAAATGGSITIEDIVPEDMDPIVNKLGEMGVKYELSDSELKILPGANLKAARIQTSYWPGFPTDLQAPFAVLATQSNGTSLVHDWMYERRLFYVDELVKMRANITICDPHRALITGPTQLRGIKILSPDLRAGIALVIAALVAKGETEIDNIELIDRGYENIEERLRSLGADIKRVG